MSTAWVTKVWVAHSCPGGRWPVSGNPFSAYWSCSPYFSSSSTTIMSDRWPLLFSFLRFAFLAVVVSDFVAPCCYSPTIPIRSGLVCFRPLQRASLTLHGLVEDPMFSKASLNSLPLTSFAPVCGKGMIPSSSGWCNLSTRDHFLFKV
ncbi:hypothetical protein LWI28_021064 [Acer negundo]|uniref:Uncharacterized protein n=1 Tax=Acer negundo TaxID=4023 RepID=A0AAD5JG36_ACENE|nr:hypothetical protein LWI28_021064 [Acer negundo]